MNSIIRYMVIFTILLEGVLVGCAGNKQEDHSMDSKTLETEKGEHSRDANSSGEGEESGTMFALDDVYNEVKNGVHLVLSYDATSNTFSGNIENITDKSIDKVRVEVHLSNGLELGPTKRTDLSPGQKVDISLKGSEKEFESWSTHAEVGSSEHGENEEHDGEEGSEHDWESGDEHKLS